MEEQKNTQSFLICPHLGILDDPDTSHAFPSSGNYCFHAKPPAVPNSEQQETVCLTAAHTSCPVYQTTKIASFPNKLMNNGKSPGQTKGFNRIYVSVAIAVLVTILAGWFAITMFTSKMISISTTGGKTQVVTIESTTVPQTDKSTTTLQQTVIFTPTIQISPTPTAQTTITVTNISNSYTLEIPFKVGGRMFLIHQVKAGEGVEHLVKTYKTTKEVIEAANYFPSIPVWADSFIVLRPGMTEVDPSEPSFQPYQVTDQAITFEELAKKLQVDLVSLKYYNACADRCILVSGSWILVARQK